MIASFRGKGTAAIFEGKLPWGFPAVARRKLRQIDAATKLVDLRTPPGNRLEALSGDRAGQHSIRVNDQWRICFVWREGNAHEVEMVGLPLTMERRMGELILRENLDGLDVSNVDSGVRLLPVPPGAGLRLDFLEPLGISARALAKRAGVPANRITAILNGERAITAETALLLGEQLNTTAEFWMNLQTAHDLELARSRRLGSERVGSTSSWTIEALNPELAEPAVQKGGE